VATLAVLFAVVLVINLAPAFAPPTWMAMSWVGFNLPQGSPFAFALVAASAATLGRTILATFARALMRSRLIREADRQNIDVVKTRLEKHKTMTVGAFFFYALSPFPSNYLFIAYGLSGLPLGAVGAAFFVGRAASYSLWAHLGRFAATHIDSETQFEGSYLSGYFIVTQFALLGVVYLLMKLDWRTLIEQRKLTWRRAIEPIDHTEQRDATHR
jgi:membrane protein DedA with SNARE-associated domain